MKQVQVRIQVSQVTSANIAYLSQCLGIPKRETYPLIVDLFLYERELQRALENLEKFRRYHQGPVDTADPLPFEE